jgi:ABC-type transporter Mla subunit MlaD
MNQESQIIKILSAIFSSTTNVTAFIIISILTIISLYGTFLSNSESLKKYAKQSPSILATVGIFFSFWGISIGLMDLDLKDIQNSIPNLLDGLKVKFIASLIGIFASILVRISQSFRVEKNEVDIEPEQKILSLLSDIKQVISENRQNSPEQILKELKETIALGLGGQRILLEAIKSSLAGEGDASVTTQLYKMRLDIQESLKELDKHSAQHFEGFNSNNRQYLSIINKTIKDSFDNQNGFFDSAFNKLIIKFDEFAKVLAENNSKAFIEALEKAMRDFNNNITEQFGENFKELNKAVGQLLEWQEKYKTHVEQLTTNFEKALSGVEAIKMAFSEIEARAQNFTDTSNKLHDILKGLDRQITDLRNHLQAFDTIADNAKQAFPIIESNLVKLTTSFKNSAEESLADIDNTVKDVGNSLKDVSNKLRDATVKMRDSIEEQKATLDTASQNFQRIVDSTLKNLAKDTQNSIDEYRDSLHNTVTEQLGTVKSGIKQSNDLINQTIQSASNEFDRSIKETAGQFNGMANTIKQSIDKQEQALTGASQEFKETINRTLRDLEEKSKVTIQNHEREMQRAVHEQMSHISNSIKTSSEQFNKLLADSMTKNTNVLAQQIEKLDASLEEELEKAISSLGSRLTSLSRRFVEDYSPLTDELRRVVRLSEEIRRGSN